MQTALQLLVTTLQIGAVYVLFSLGLTLIFGVMRIVNFAHGHLFAISALVVASVLPALVERGLSVASAYALASLAGVAVSLALGLLVYRFGLRFFQRDMVGSFIFTIGLVLLLDGAMLRVFGGTVRPVPEILAGKVSVLGAPVAVQRLVLCVAAVVVTVALYWVLAGTRLGKALRAVSIDHEAAMLQGVPYGRIALSGFLLATALAATAGALIAPASVVSPVLGADYLVKGFIGVVVGGLGSVPGAIVGSLFIAAIEAVGGFYLDSSSATIAMFSLVIVVLLVRPRGLLGHG